MEDSSPSRRRRLRPLRLLLVVLIVAVVGLGAYIGWAAWRSAQPVTLPAPGGPYAVGRTITEWTDHARADPLAPETGSPRRLSVWLWYPASPEAGAQTAPYAPGAWAGVHMGGVLAWAETSFGKVRIHAFADAPVAAGRFPVVVLEPGLGFAAMQYTAIAESLAADGYLVVGVTPTYSANLTVLDGQTIPANEAGNPPESNADDLHTGPAQAAGDRLVGVWAADGRFAAGHSATLDTGGRFAGHVDTTRTVYIGHSFGGAAALEACRTDPHCTGAADLDGTQYGPVVHTGLGKPVMIIGSQHSCVTGTCLPTGPADRTDETTARTLIDSGTAPVRCYRVTGAEHFNFTDYGVYRLAAPLSSLIALGDIEGGEALRITSAYLRAFADHVTAGRPEPLLDGPSPFPQVQVQRTAI